MAAASMTPQDATQQLRNAIRTHQPLARIRELVEHDHADVNGRGRLDRPLLFDVIEQDAYDEYAYEDARPNIRRSMYFLSRPELRLDAVNPRNGKTALHQIIPWVLMKPNMRPVLIEMLETRGLAADHGLSVTDHQGNTPLHDAIYQSFHFADRFTAEEQQHHADVIRYLVQQGAPVDQPNMQDETPMDLAEKIAYAPVRDQILAALRGQAAPLAQGGRRRKNKKAHRTRVKRSKRTRARTIRR